MNMTHTMSITEARSQLLRLPKRLQAGSPHALEVTHHGKPQLAILPFELYESIVETLEVLADDAMTKALRRSLKELGAGKSIPWSKAKARLKP